jgi:hypothetical protein
MKSWVFNSLNSSLQKLLVKILSLLETMFFWKTLKHDNIIVGVLYPGYHGSPVMVRNLDMISSLTQLRNQASRTEEGPTTPT